jgi:putative flippase GtrA
LATKKIGGIKLFKLTVKYALFAAISTIGNLLTQQLCLMLFNSLTFLKSFENVSILGLFNFNFVLMTAIFMGTLVGLIIKYILDKKYIFNYKTRSKSEDTGKFIMYSFMGVFTTAIFWSFELIFDGIFNYQYAKYLGALIGLTIGYIIKYNLDKRFVFNMEQHQPSQDKKV